MTSDFCIDGEYFVRTQHRCFPCQTKFSLKKGFQFTANCGVYDDGRIQVNGTYRKCENGKFNNGSFIECQKCTLCSSPHLTASPCNSESNTFCCKDGEEVRNRQCFIRQSTTSATTGSITESSPTISRSTESTTAATSVSITKISPTHSFHANVTLIYLYLGVISLFFLLLLLFIIWRRTKHQSLLPIKIHSQKKIKEHNCNGEQKEILLNEVNSQTALNTRIYESKHTDMPQTANGSSSNKLAPEILNAPLNTLLNNLDVLEELVLLLDPDISGMKNTRHLAAQCSFSFSWINYAYLMKETKSPLVAVLEGVVAKNPDWTIRDFAKLLTAIGRNDAVMILERLPATATNNTSLRISYF